MDFELTILQYSLCAWDSLNPWINLGGLVKSPRESFKNPLGHVMRIPAGQDIHMKVHPPMDGKGTEKFLNELEGKTPPDRFHILGSIEREIRAPAQIDHHTDKSLIHWNIRKPIAPDPRLVIQGSPQGLPERDPRILDCVVKINVQVAFGVDLKVEQPMTGKQSQHVIKERDPGHKFGISLAINDKPQCDGCFGRLSFNFCLSRHELKQITECPA